MSFPDPATTEWVPMWALNARNVQDEGTGLPAQPTLNFVGAGVTAANDAANTRTTITIPGGAVTTVFGRSGAVVAVATDYTPSFIGAALAVHTHAAADIVSGVIAPARLGSGTPSASNYLRGDGAWQTVSTGSPQTPWAQDINAAGFKLINTGFVGIGTTPATNLHVLTSSGAVNTEVRIESSATTSPFISYIRGTQSWWAGCGVLDAGWTLYDFTAPRTVIHATTAGNVGIGTTDPSNDRLRVTSLSTLRVYVGEATRTWLGTMGARLELASDGTPGAGGYNGIAIAPTTGFVGIGTTAPESRLQLGVAGGGSGFPTYRGSIILNEYNATLNSHMGIEFLTRGDGGGYGWRLSSLANNADFVFESRSASATWIERVRILNNGNVGIGTASPNHKLAIVNTVADPVLGGARGNLAIHGDALEWGLFFGGYGNGSSWIQAQRADANTSAYNICLNPLGGNVGIGTASAVARLHVIAISTNPSLIADTEAVYFGYSSSIGLAFGSYPSGSFAAWIQTKRTTNTGNADALAIQPLGGPVGIGTDSPQEALHVQRQTANCAVKIATADTASAFVFYNRAGYQWWEGVGLEGTASFSIYDVSVGRTMLSLRDSGIVMMYLGGSLKTLTVDGSGFVKAT